MPKAYKMCQEKLMLVNLLYKLIILCFKMKEIQRHVHYTQFLSPSLRNKHKSDKVKKFPITNTCIEMNPLILTKQCRRDNSIICTTPACHFPTIHTTQSGKTTTWETPWPLPSFTTTYVLQQWHFCKCKNTLILSIAHLLTYMVVTKGTLEIKTDTRGMNIKIATFLCT